MKRKRDADAKQDAQLQEYLSVKQRSSKNKTWANDEDMPKPDGGHTEDQSAEARQFEEPASAERKKIKVNGPLETSPTPGSGDRNPEHMMVDNEKEAATASGDENVASEPQDEAVSDADWLRSKTSRLLGLLDDDEQAEFNAKSDQKTAASPERETNQMSDTQGVAGAHAQPGTNAGEADKLPEVDLNVESIRNSARLFVRNLPYDAKEADLETLFSPFGKTEEVSYITAPLPSISDGCSNDDIPDRDIRCKAHDVNGIEYFSRCL